MQEQGLDEKGKNWIVPKIPGKLMRESMIPDLPLMIEKNGQQISSFSYEGPLLKYRGDTNKELLKEFGFTDEDFKFRDV